MSHEPQHEVASGEGSQVRQFFGWALITIGIFWVVITGACTLYVAGTSWKDFGELAVETGILSACVGSALIFVGRSIAGD